jgi:DNA-binding MarR family transcriptional regulator
LETNLKQEERLIALLKSMTSLHMGEAMLTKIDLSISQMALLRLVAQSPGCHVQEIADGLGLSAPTVSVGVRKLVEAGLLERVPDPEDRRAACVYLSEIGKAMQKKFIERRHAEVQRFLGALTPSEQEQLIDLLGKAFSALAMNQLPERKEMQSVEKEIE